MNKERRLMAELAIESTCMICRKSFHAPVVRAHATVSTMFMALPQEINT